MIKTKSKKILSLVLTLCMVLSLLPMNAFALKSASISELTITVSDQGVISGNEATASGTLYYYLVSSDPASTIEGWTTDTEKSTVDSELSVSGDTSAPSLTDSDNGKYLVVVEFDGSEKVVAAGASAAISITASKAIAELTITVSDQGVISGNEATASGTLYYYLVSSDPASTIEGWTTDTEKSTVDSELSVSGDTSAPSLTDSDNGKYLVVVEFDGSEKVVAAGASAAISITAAESGKTATPQAADSFEEIVAEAGNESAKVGVANFDAYETPDNITVEVYQDTDGQKGEEADGVTGKYTETEEAGTLTLTFNEALTKVTTYWITFQDGGSDASEPVKLVVQPVTAQPTITQVTAKSEDNKTATFTVTNTQDYAEGGSVAVTLYTDANGEDAATGVEGAYNLDGTLTLTFTNTLDADQKLYAAFTYTPEGDGAQAWAPSPVSAELTVQYTPTTAMPKLEGQETVEITCTSKTSAEIALTNASAYKGTPEVKVYSQATGGEAVKDPTAKYADGKITLTFTSPIEAQQTYYISMTEDQKLESERLKVIVNPYEAEEGTGITAVSTTIESDTVNAVNGGTEELDGTTPEKAIPWTFSVLKDQLSKLTSVTLTMESAKATVSYLACAEANVSDGSSISQSAGENNGAVTISSLNFETNKALYVKVTSEADAEGTNPVYYLITVEALNVTAAEAQVTENLGTYQEALRDANLDQTKLNADSQKVMNQAIMDSIAANDTLTGQMDNEGTFDNRESEPDTIWGKLYAANDTIVTGKITYYYVPYMDLQVTDYDVSGDDKTLTMDITPKYSVIATTADSFNNAKWTGDKAQINAVQLSTNNTVDLTNVTIEIPVPTEIGGDGTTVYVVHGSDSWQCKVESSKVSVTVPSFSPFTLQTKATGAATIDGKVYSTVQAAVDAVTKDGKIILTNAATQDELKALKAPTQLANTDTFTIEAGDSGLKVDESDVTFTDTTEDNVTYKATMGSSGKVTISTTQLYDIKITTTGSGSITANPNPAAKEAEVTLTVSGTLKGELKVVNYNTDEKIEATTTDNGKTYTFTMPDSTVIITAEFESSGGYTGGGGGGAGSSTTVNSSKAINGSFAISDKNAKAGDTVKITPKANDGYVVDQVTVTDKNGNNITVTQNADGTYSFVMPAKSAQPVDVKVTFKLDDGEKDCPSEKFTDVDQNKWYHEGVDYAIKNGLMNGTGANTFAPDATTTRAMVVTILYRLDGEPAVTKDIPFADVPAGQWYSNAINWAAANGIVDGYGNGKFGPDDTITREQMAAILYRYASYKGYSVSDLANLTGYTDAASVSEWASTAMRWAVAEGLIEGTNATTLSPSGDSTRAQVATILMRFCEGVVK